MHMLYFFNCRNWLRVLGLLCHENLLLAQSQKASEDQIIAPLSMNFLEAKLILVKFEIKRFCKQISLGMHWKSSSEW